jgi:hypothetical protein
MTMRRLLQRLVVLSLFVAVPALAQAPSNQYEPYDRTTPTITDHFTKLEWDRFKVNDLISHDNAVNYCTTAFLGGGGRLPTVKELLTILDEEPHQEYEGTAYVTKWIDRNAFGNADQTGKVITTPVDKAYWSDTQTYLGPGTFWSVDFSTGQMKPATATSSLAVRCVR